MQKCVNCERTEDKMPLLTLQYKGENLYLCSGCMPILLHAPAKMAGKLKDADKIEAAKH